MHADLQYNLADGHLSGSIGGYKISARAGSGGRAGSKTPDALNWWLANNPFAVCVKLSSGNPGGPLPMGRYRLALHESRKNWIRLLPFSQAMFGREGFAIHGRGLRGSDGCIVPSDFLVVLQICSALAQIERSGGPAPVLEVVAEGQDLARQINTA